MLLARRHDRLEALRDQLQFTYHVPVHTVQLDVRNIAEVDLLPQQLPPEFAEVHAYSWGVTKQRSSAWLAWLGLNGDAQHRQLPGSAALSSGVNSCKIDARPAWDTGGGSMWVGSNQPIAPKQVHPHHHHHETMLPSTQAHAFHAAPFTRSFAMST